MADTHSDDPQAVSERRRRGPVARLALTRRVVAALEPLEGASIEADVENPALGPTATSTPLLRTDLLIRALDLRVRVALLPGAAHEELGSEDVTRAALLLLLDNPETASIAVVIDDTDLTCRIIEPFDRQDAAVSATVPDPDLAVPRWGPVGKVVRAYLRQISPPWDPPTQILPASEEIDAVALQAAQGALTALQSQRKNTPEWRTARTGLGDADTLWVRDLALAVLLNELDASAVKAALDARAGRLT